MGVLVPSKGNIQQQGIKRYILCVQGFHSSLSGYFYFYYLLLFLFLMALYDTVELTTDWRL